LHEFGFSLADLERFGGVVGLRVEGLGHGEGYFFDFEWLISYNFLCKGSGLLLWDLGNNR
jgi:hypothetical protein